MLKNLALFIKGQLLMELTILCLHIPYILRRQLYAIIHNFSISYVFFSFFMNCSLMLRHSEQNKTVSLPIGVKVSFSAR